MKNWKEDAEAELARRIAEGQARKTEVDTSRMAHQIIPLEADMRRRHEIHVVRFDALNIPQKLTDINRDVLRGLGDIQQAGGNWTPRSNRRGDEEEDVIVTLSHSRVKPDDVEVQGHTLYKRKFGAYKTTYTSSTMTEHMGYDHGETHNYWHFGGHNVPVGYEITGHFIKKITPLSLSVAFRTQLSDEHFDQDGMRVTIGDMFTRLGQPAVPIGNNWQIRAFSDLSERTNVPHGTRRNYVQITIPDAEYDAEMLNVLIDAVLVQSCIERLPHVDEWAKERIKVNAIAPSIFGKPYSR